MFGGLNLNHLINIVYESIGSAKVISEADKVTERLTQIKKIYATTPEGGKALKEIQETFKPMAKDTAKASQKMGDFEKAIRRVAIVAPVWTIFRNAMMSTFKLLGEQVQFLKELETAMARIRIVGKGTEEQYDSLRITLINLATTYGSLSKEVADAAVLFAQQGRNVEEIIKLTQASVLGAKVLGTDVRSVADDLTSAIEGFNIGVSSSISIIDKWINVEKNFAVTSKDLADATKTAGATANQLGVSMSEFLGDVTAIVETTRKSGSAAANALQFIYARVYSTGRKTIEQIAKIPFFLDEQGKATFELTGEYRNLSDILTDLAFKWDTLTKKEKLDIAQVVASKRQMTAFLALMQNYRTSIEARIKALDSAGAAQQAFNIIEETTEVKIKKLNATWNQMTASIADTSTWKAVLDVMSIGLKNLISDINPLFSLHMAFDDARESVNRHIATQQGMIEQFKELLTLRERLASAPQENPLVVEQLTEVNKIIDELIKKSPSLKGTNIFASLNLSNLKGARTELDNFVNQLKKEEIKIQTELEFNFKRKDLEIQLADAVKNISNEKVLNITLNSLSNELVNLEENKNKAIEKRLDDYEKEQTLLKIRKQIEAEALDLSEQLTDADEERIKINSTLNELRESGKFTTLELINAEIELVKQSSFLYEGRKKLLQVAELEAKKRTEALGIINTLLKHELDLAQLRGATDKDLLELEVKLGTISKNSLDYRLRMEKLLTQERLKQFEISDDALKIYKVYQQYGLRIAEEIGKFNTGMMNFDQLSRKAQDVWKEMFPERAEAQKVMEFFGLTRDFRKLPFGERSTLGGGGQIPIPETVSIAQVRNLEKLIRDTLGKTSISTEIQQLIVQISEQVTGTESVEERVKQITEDLAEKIRTNPDIKQAIQEQIESY